MRPILHLSLPVRDLQEAEDYYARMLGCQVARRRTDFIDVWFFGLQLTLHERPEEVTGLVPGGSRHFGVTLGPDDFGALVARLEDSGAHWLVPVTTDDAGLPTEQTKAKVVDPSGNVIEVKTYPDVVAALELPSEAVSWRGRSGGPDPAADVIGRVEGAHTLVAYGGGRDGRFGEESSGSK